MYITVALTSCAKDTSTRGTVRWPFHKQITGIKDVSTFSRTGEFVCEIPGLYLLSVHILSQSVNANYLIFKNANYITDVYVKGSSSGSDDLTTGTAVVVAELDVGDKMYTIIKIK